MEIRGGDIFQRKPRAVHRARVRDRRGAGVRAHALLCLGGLWHPAERAGETGFIADGGPNVKITHERP